MIGEVDNEFGYEEADLSIIAYANQVAKTGTRHLQILADDTDIFILLLYWYWLTKHSALITMRRFDGRVIDIAATAMTLGNSCKNILAIHALTGCDTVSYPFGKGKIKAITLLKNNQCDLHLIGNIETPHSLLFEKSRNFFCLLYGGKCGMTMNDLRCSLFTKRKGIPPKLKTLPPTDDNLAFHVRRAHFQVMLWKAAAQGKHSVNIDACCYGWEKQNEKLIPVTSHNPPAPSAVMKVIACGCNESACSRMNCSCRSAGLSCTAYCKCSASVQCKNELTVPDHDEDSDGDNIEED